MSARSYNPSVRVGNWNEDLCLEEDLLKDFLEKKEKGELMIQKTSNLLTTILKEVKLSSPADGVIRIGDAVCLLHLPTQSVLSAYMPAAQAHEAKQLVSGCNVACSKRLQPCPRNVFIIGSYDSQDARPGDVVCYGQYITLTTLPNEGGQLSLQSDRATFMKHSKYTREQEITLEEDICYKSAWRVLCFDQEERLETEGTPVPANRRVFINHCKTNQHLAVHTEWTHKTPFGREFETTACTKFNTHKVEDLHNHFVIATESPQDLVASVTS